jgi:lactobin A/cerein 7B family class IIb bacteriocin
MKNLENFGIQELSTKEIKETDGGFIPLVIWGIAFTASEVAGILVGTAIGVAVSQDLDNLADSFMEGFNNARN